MSDLISRQAAIDEIRDFQLQITCSFSGEWLNGMDEGFNHAVDVIELMETADAIPIEWIRKWMDRQNSWNLEGVITLMREWAERKEE